MNNTGKDIDNKTGISSRDLNIALLAGVSVIIFICFHYTLQNSFLTDWDDWIYISKDPYITSFTASHFNSMLFHDITLNYYHPLTMLSFAVNYQFSQLSPWGYYFTNILLHILNAILIFYFTKILMETMVKVGYEAMKIIPWLLAVGALMHGIHPMHVESVSWIAERKDVMYSVFYFIGLIMYVRYMQGAKFKWMLYLNIFFAVLCVFGIIGLTDFSLGFALKGDNFSIPDSLICAFLFVLIAIAIAAELKYIKIKTGLFYIWEFFLLSLFSKPMAVSFPLSMLVVDILLRRDSQLTIGINWVYSEVKTLIKLVAEKWAFFVIAFLSGLQSVFLEIGHNTVVFTHGYTVFQKLLIACYAFTMYTVKAFFPANLCSYYPYPGLTSQHYLPYIYYAAPFFTAAIIFIPLFIARKDKDLFRVVLFGLGFYFANLVFILQFLSAGATIISDRYSYVSYFGLIFILVYLAHWLWYKNKSYHIAIQCSLALVCATLGYLSYERTKVWHNPETLWTDVAAKTNRQTQLPYLNLGNYYVDSGRYDKAYIDYAILLRLHTDQSIVYRNMGNIYGMRKQFDSSIYCFGMALKYDSTDASIYNNRGVTYANLGKFDVALNDFIKAYALDTTQVGVLEEIAGTLTRLGRFSEAVSQYNKLIQKEPKALSFYLLCGNACFNAGNPEMAIKYYQRLIELQSNNGECMYCMSAAYHALKDNANAIKYATMAQHAGYKIPDSYLNTLK